MSKVCNFLSTFSIVIAILSLYIFTIATDNFQFNGYTLLLLLLMLLNPISNLCSIKKKIIDNPLYHLIVVLGTIYLSYVSINGVIIYNTNVKGLTDNSDALNIASNYFGDRMLYILIGALILFLLGFLFKKSESRIINDNSNMMLALISTTALIPLLKGAIWRMELISAGFNIALFIFVVIIRYKSNSVNTASELRAYYLILILCAIASINPIALVLAIYMFIQQDTFGLHI